jgi:hypothetical protein
MKLFIPALSYFCVVAGLRIPENAVPPSVAINREEILPRDTNCENTATSRSCWGEYSIDTDYYNIVPDTGVTREVSLALQPESILFTKSNCVCLVLSTGWLPRILPLLRMDISDKFLLLMVQFLDLQLKPTGVTTL